MLSAGSYQSRSSALSGQSDGSLLSWQSSNAVRGRRETGRLDGKVVGSLVAGSLLVAAVVCYSRLRRSG
jgi:hypothetical protein